MQELPAFQRIVTGPGFVNGQVIVTYGLTRFVLDDSMDLAQVQAQFENLYLDRPVNEGSSVELPELNNSTVTVSGVSGDWTVTLASTSTAEGT